MSKINLFQILFLIGLLAFGSKAQNNTSISSTDIIKSLEVMDTYVEQLQRKYNKDEYIRERVPQISTKLKELRNLINKLQKKQTSKIYLDSLVVYENLLKEYAENNSKKLDEKLKKGLKELDDELSVKIIFGKASRGSEITFIDVIVETLKDGQEKGDYEIWYVSKGWADEKSHYQRFDSLSTPAIMNLPPGNYLIWTRKNGIVTEATPLSLGGDKRSRRVIQLIVR
jgi:hypothetical protein